MDCVLETPLHQTPPYTARLLGIVGVALYTASAKCFSEKSPFDRDCIDGWCVGKKLFFQHASFSPLFLGWIEASMATLLLEIGKDYIPALSSEKIRAIYENHQTQNMSITTIRLMQALSPWDPKPVSNFFTYSQMFQNWKKELRNYLEKRMNDGWKQAQEVPATFPNKGHYIPVGNKRVEQEIIPELPVPDAFTLLALYDKYGTITSRQQYLGASFGHVDISKLVSPEIVENMTTMVNQNMPTAEQRRQEILSLQYPPDDKGRARAEVWAGSFSGYLNPPMTSIWLALYYYLSKSVPLESSIAPISSICIGMFVAATICWKCKYEITTRVPQARPIQDFRRWYPEVEITHWNGEKTLGMHWLPYQPLSSPTPPFPDMPSGHSTFTSVLSYLMRLWTKHDALDIPIIPLDIEFVKRLSPALTSRMSTTFDGQRLVICAGASTIDPQESPTSPVFLDLSTWSGIVEMVGRSRIDGGIHTESANCVGQLLGEHIAYELRHLYRFPSAAKN